VVDLVLRWDGPVDSRWVLIRGARAGGPRRCGRRLVRGRTGPHRLTSAALGTRGWPPMVPMPTPILRLRPPPT